MILLPKLTDAAIAIIVLVIGLWILTRLGISLGTIITMAKRFIYGSSPTTNTTSGLILGMSASGSRLREKKRRVLEYIRRKIFLDQNHILPKSPNRGGGRS